MADTSRSRSEVLTMMADNVTGQISAQDLRDFTVTIMQPEYIGPYDFWNTPTSDNITTDQTTRGTHIYSQIVSSNVTLSFGKIYCLTSKNTWSNAAASVKVNNFFIGVAADSYVINATDARILLKGIVYDSDLLATRLSGNIGSPIYLMSKHTEHISVTNDGWSKIIGVVLTAGKNSVQTKGKWYFDPSMGWPVITGA